MTQQSEATAVVPIRHIIRTIQAEANIWIGLVNDDASAGRGGGTLHMSPRMHKDKIIYKIAKEDEGAELYGKLSGAIIDFPYDMGGEKDRAKTLELCEIIGLAGGESADLEVDFTESGFCFVHIEQLDYQPLPGMTLSSYDEWGDAVMFSGGCMSFFLSPQNRIRGERDREAREYYPKTQVIELLASVMTQFKETGTIPDGLENETMNDTHERYARFILSNYKSSSVTPDDVLRSLPEMPPHHEYAAGEKPGMMV